MKNYNSTLQLNNADLQFIFDTISILPKNGEQATPIISIASSGLITATVGDKVSTHQLAFEPAKTINPTTSDQYAVRSGYYVGGTIDVEGDKNLVASNIKGGINIFGVSGNYTVEHGDSAFIDGTISSLVNSSIATIGSNAFYYCSNLTTVSLPACTDIGEYAFYFCSNLTTASFPACTSIGNSAFQYCTDLTTVSFPACTSIGGNAFNGCYNLKSLYLTGFSLCNLAASNAFTSTPIGGYSTSAGTYGSIYVPASLLTSYQTATNWTYFSSRFVGI